MAALTAARPVSTSVSHDAERRSSDEKDALAIIVDAPATWVRWPGAPARIPPIRRFLPQRIPGIAYQAHPDL
jgi:hypothetical protein